MEDKEIIELYWRREERAIDESSKKYGGLCASVAGRLLMSREDCEECVSDTWLRAWNAMPPERPNILKAFFARITRNLALDRLRKSSAAKRGGGEAPLALEELGECVSGKPIESELELQRVTEVLNGFLRGLSARDRELFMRRYWSAEPVADIARRLKMSRQAAATQLFRLRQSLRRKLEEEEIAL